MSAGAAGPPARLLPAQVEQRLFAVGGRGASKSLIPWPDCVAAFDLAKRQWLPPGTRTLSFALSSLFGGQGQLPARTWLAASARLHAWYARCRLAWALRCSVKYASSKEENEYK